MRWVGNGYELWQLDTQTMTAEITPEASSTSHFNSNTCFLPEKLPPSLDNKGYNPIVRLRAGDGFFLGKGSKETPYQSIQVFLTTPDGSQIKPTGLKVQEDKCSLPSPIWISFVGKYFIADYTCITPENAAVIPSDVYTPVATKGWWLSSDGSSEPADFMIPQEILLPSDVITDGNVFVDPVARGFLITTTQRPYKETESAQAGVYLLKSDGSFSKLLSGFSRRPVITPDGCKAAFGVQDKMNYNPLAGVYTLSEPELTVLDLCTEQSP